MKGIDRLDAWLKAGTRIGAYSGLTMSAKCRAKKHHASGLAVGTRNFGQDDDITVLTLARLVPALDWLRLCRPSASPYVLPSIRLVGYPLDVFYVR